MSEPEHEELLALREHLDTVDSQIIRDLQIACHACANYFNCGILVAQGRASTGDLNMAYGIAITALERAGYVLEVSP